MSKFARRCAALMLAVVLLCMAVPAAFAAEGDTLPAGATTMGGANTTLIPDEEENCLSWLFGSGDTITMPYLNVKGQGLRRNVTLDLEDCLVGITYTELGSIGSYVSDAAGMEGAGCGHPLLSGIPQKVRLFGQRAGVHPCGSDPFLCPQRHPQGSF